MEGRGWGGEGTGEGGQERGGGERGDGRGWDGRGEGVGEVREVRDMHKHTIMYVHTYVCSDTNTNGHTVRTLSVV